MEIILTAVIGFISGFCVMYLIHNILFDVYQARHLETIKKLKDAAGNRIEIYENHTFAKPEDVQEVKFNDRW